MAPPFRLAAPATLLVLVLLSFVVAAPTAAAAAGAAAAANKAEPKSANGGSNHKNSNNHASADGARYHHDKCPGDSCGLATEAEVSAAVEALLAYETPVAGTAYGTLSADRKSCKAEVVFSHDPERPFRAGCVVYPDQPVPMAVLIGRCPSGYKMAMQSRCTPELINESDGKQLSWGWPLVISGEFGPNGDCGVATESVPVPDGAVIRIRQNLGCIFDETVFDPNAQKKKGGSAGGKATLATSPRGQRILAALRAAAAEDFKEGGMALPEGLETPWDRAGTA